VTLAWESGATLSISSRLTNGLAAGWGRMSMLLTGSTPTHPWIRLILHITITRASRNWELAVGLLGALFAIGVHSLTDFNLYIPANALTLAWLSGMADSLGLRER
jgi:hypothetical protein